MKRINAILIMIVVFLADLATKTLIIDLDFSRSIFRGFFSLVIDVTVNRNFVFSIPAPKILIFIVVFIVLAIVVKLFRDALIEKQRQAYPIALILGGAMGNLYDRFAYGGVVDFIEVSVAQLSWSSFNLADILILVGALWWLSLIRKPSL